MILTMSANTFRFRSSKSYKKSDNKYKGIIDSSNNSNKWHFLQDSNIFFKDKDEHECNSTNIDQYSSQVT